MMEPTIDVPDFAVEAGKTTAGQVTGSGFGTPNNRLFCVKVSGPDWLWTPEDGTLLVLPPAGISGEFPYTIAAVTATGEIVQATGTITVT